MRELKRRQAWQVAGFLTVVAGVTATLFFVVHGDRVAERRGFDALARGDVGAAVSWFERGGAATRRSPAMRAAAARAYERAGRFDDALNVYERLVRDGYREHVPVYVGLAQQRGQPGRAIAYYAERGPRTALPGADLVQLGDLLQQAGKFEDAVACYRLAAERLPRNVEILARLGIVLSWMGRFREAEVPLAQAVELAPQHRLAQIYLARAAASDGRFADAVTHYRAILPR